MAPRAARASPSTFLEAVSEASCCELLAILLCLACVLFTFTCAFFMPEIGNWLAGAVQANVHTGSSDGKGRHERAPPVRESAYHWRNDSQRAGAARCLQDGAASVFLQPLSLSRLAPRPGADAEQKPLAWRLQDIVVAELCGKGKEPTKAVRRGDHATNTPHAHGAHPSTVVSQAPALSLPPRMPQHTSGQEARSLGSHG
jgi:hypothetical protein